MNAKELTLHIAINLGRIGQWALDGNRNRIDQFLKETEGFVDQLDHAPKNPRFLPTFTLFKKKFNALKANVGLNDVWAEEVFTWANILTHRSKFA